MDLPQATIQEVRLNPFVIDLVNLPFIKAGIEGFLNHEVSLVDNIHLYSLPTIPSPVQLCLLLLYDYHFMITILW